MKLKEELAQGKDEIKLTEEQDKIEKDKTLNSDLNFRCVNRTPEIM